MASTIRSFIAVELSTNHQRLVNQKIKTYGAKWPEYRWMDSGQLHLTLNFLGDVRDEKIPAVCQIMRETASRHSAFSFTLGGPGAFPKASRPRIVWIGIDHGKSELARLHYDLAEGLEELRLERDRKGYRPHITLGRIRNNMRWPDSMVEFLSVEPPAEGKSGDVDELVLYASHLEKSGPVYTVMDRAPLA